ncbi:MAG TPA: glycoside hydrolase family 127 protein [bacterium]|nr:glycoside hydrolase family 127 protein [bacterium]
MVPIQGRDVVLGGEIGRRIDITVQNNLLVMDIDNDFLLPFKEKNRRDGYVGLGKTLEAVSRFAAYTKNERVEALRKHVIKEILAAQEPDGYLGIMEPGSRLWKLWDIHEMSYLIQGLTVNYQLIHDKDSLDAARKIADYIIHNWAAQPDKIPGNGEISTLMAVTGSEPALLNLYQVTGDDRYLKYCTEFRQLPEWAGPIVLGRWGTIDGHAYACMSRCIAQLRLYQIQPHPEWLDTSHRVVNFLTKEDGMVITGTCGDHECWHDTQEGTINLGETCATAYLIRLMDELFRIEAKPIYGDIMERAIFNSLFASQSPDGRKIRYYTPFDGPRSYFDKDTYCCPCNFRRIIAELPNMIYYRSPSGIFVNLYTASKATIAWTPDNPVQIEQETDYPNSGNILFHIDPKTTARFALQLRIPRWCSEAAISVNDQPTALRAEGGTLHSIDREWRPGDRVVLDMPMPFRWVKGRKAQAGRVALMHGPLVFTLSRARHPELDNVDLRLLVADLSSLTGPKPDSTVREGGLACELHAWGPGEWYPFAKPQLTLTLTEFPDPDGELCYFKIADPKDPMLESDELSQTVYSP